MSPDQWKQYYKDQANKNTWAVVDEAKNMLASSSISDNRVINALAFPVLVFGGAEVLDALKIGKGLATTVKVSDKAADMFRAVVKSDVIGDLGSIVRYAKDA